MPAHSLFLSRLKPEQRRELENRLFARQNEVCFICDDAIDLELQRKTLEIDHIIPIAVEGKDDENNFALVHGDFIALRRKRMKSQRGRAKVRISDTC